MSTALISVPPRGAVSLLGVRFRPGEAFAFLRGLPARGLRDALVPLRDAVPAFARDVGDRLASLPGTPARLRALDALLLRTRDRAPDARVRRAILELERGPGVIRVASLATSLGVGERQLERLFDERVGVGPKMLGRVARVQRLLERLARGEPLAHAATELGFADQAHLTRDVRDLAGLTPGELARAIEMSDSFNRPQGPLPMLDPC
jgi:AraC-like DNA-binding protein